MKLFNLFKTDRQRAIESKREHEKQWNDFCNEPDNPFNSPEARELARQNQEALEELERLYPNMPKYVSVSEYPCRECNHKGEQHWRGYCLEGKCKCRVTRMEIVEWHREENNEED